MVPRYQELAGSHPLQSTPLQSFHLRAAAPPQQHAPQPSIPTPITTNDGNVTPYVHTVLAPYTQSLLVPNMQAVAGYQPGWDASPSIRSAQPTNADAGLKKRIGKPLPNKGQMLKMQSPLTNGGQLHGLVAQSVVNQTASGDSLTGCDPSPPITSAQSTNADAKHMLNMQKPLPNKGHLHMPMIRNVSCQNTASDSLSGCDFMSSRMVRSIQERCGHFLALLKGRGVFDKLHPTDGVPLRISVPFCGGFFEAPTLAKFFAGFVDEARIQTHSVDIFCSDIYPNAALVALASIENDPRVKFTFERLDLADQELPSVDLVLGFHPEVTRMQTRELWKSIIVKCARAAPLSVFTTLHENEALLVLEHAKAAGAATAEILPGLARGVVHPDDTGGGYDSHRFCHFVLVHRQ